MLLICWIVEKIETLGIREHLASDTMPYRDFDTHEQSFPHFTRNGKKVLIVVGVFSHMITACQPILKPCIEIHATPLTLLS